MQNKLKILIRTIIFITVLLGLKILFTNYTPQQIFIIVLTSSIVAAIYYLLRDKIKNIPDDFDMFGF